MRRIAAATAGGRTLPATSAPAPAEDCSEVKSAVEDAPSLLLVVEVVALVVLVVSSQLAGTVQRLYESRDERLVGQQALRRSWGHRIHRLAFTINICNLVPIHV